MYALLLIFLSMIFLQGCTHVSRKGVMSEELPLSVQDIADVRKGEENHQEVLKEHALYQNPVLGDYLNRIAANIAEVSTRPNLPYRVFILDEDDANLFGGPGGHIYITRGLLQFTESESEIAGVLAHEIGHITSHHYTDFPHHKKIKLMYKGLLKGSELAKNSIGTYGSAAYYGIKGIGRVAPHIAKHFDPDAEVAADKKTIEYLMKAHYDPRAYRVFVERIARIHKAHLNRFVALLNTHPPFKQRRELLDKQLGEINFEVGNIEFRTDTLGEVRKAVVVEQPEEPSLGTNIVFQPEFGVRHIDPVEMNQMQRDKEEKLVSVRKRWEGF